MSEFKRSWQLWKPLKNHWFLFCFQPSEGPGGVLEGPWGSPGGLGGPPRRSERLLGDHLGALERSEGLKARILRGFVSTWGVLGWPSGARGGAQKPMSYFETHQ